MWVFGLSGDTLDPAMEIDMQTYSKTRHSSPARLTK